MTGASITNLMALLREIRDLLKSVDAQLQEIAANTRRLP